MKLIRINFPYFFLIILISIVAVFDLFINKGRPATMDALIHISSIAMFKQALLQGDFPVRWIDGFGNYGYPLGIIAHQLPIYLGALINSVIGDPVTAFNIVCFIGILLSNILFFLFLRLYFNPEASFLGTFLLNFAPYRIINLYIRGAIPEVFSNIFLPLILIGIFFFIKKKNINGLFLLVISLSCMALTHPMAIIIYSFIFIPYAIFVLLEESDFSLKKLISRPNLLAVSYLGAGGLLALGIAAYYILVLNLEIKYLYFGGSKNHLTPDQYMGLRNYFDPKWYYYTKTEIFTRGHFIKSGLLETVGIFIGLGLVIWQWIKNKKIKFGILEFAVFVSLLIAFFTISYSNFFYSHINVLSSIQFPWRMFSAFMFLPPIIFAFIFNKLDKRYLIIIFIIFVAVVRFPQLYGKNYTNYPASTYLFTPVNLHSTSMNTIWTGVTESYPIKKNKPEIVEGEGVIINQKVKNSSREYVIDAKTNLKMVDYTFYFPRWILYVDKKSAPIEFQNPNYRGVVTYSIPQGRHSIELRFEDTKVRKFGKIISIFSFLVLAVLFLFRRKLPIK